jgi:hypothetical protein
MAGYRQLLEDNGCTVEAADDTGRFPAYIDLYLNMVDMQLTFDALKILGFQMGVLQAVAGEFAFIRELAHAGKVAQGRFIARRE